MAIFSGHTDLQQTLPKVPLLDTKKLQCHFLFDWQKIHIKKESFKTFDIAENKVLIQQLFKRHLSGSNAIPFVEIIHIFCVLVFT